MMFFDSNGKEIDKPKEDEVADQNDGFEETLKKSLLKALREYDLTDELLKKQSWPNYSLYAYLTCVSAVLYLIKIKGTASEDALKTVTSTYWSGGNVEDICEGFSPYGVDALARLLPYVQAGQLDGKTWLNFWDHRAILIRLIINEKKDASIAIAETEKLDRRQAHMVRQGLTLTQIADLMKLTENGLVDSCVTLCLHDDNPNGYEISQKFSIRSAYFYLMGTKKMDAESARIEMRGLNHFQAHAISRGLTRQQVEGLSEWQVFAMETLHNRGLTAEHLRGKEWINNLSKVQYLAELIEKTSVENAMNKLKHTYVEDTADDAVRAIQGLFERASIGMKR